MPRAEDHVDAGPDEEVRPYKIHVSNKYTDLTRQKLHLTRLPRGGPEPASTEWWDPKPTIEPLIDYWLEHYSWREQQERLNSSAPQFRTSITIPQSRSPLRIHFLHSRSPYSNAIPLLLIPPFPFTNLSLTHLINVFTDPDDVDTEQPFHLVIPSLPGLGFSDALPSSSQMIPTTAYMFDRLMDRLGYTHYLTTNSGPSANTPSEIDWRIADHLSAHFQDSCLGTHFINPPLSAPKIKESPFEWLKWKTACLFKANAFGYSRDDLSAIQKEEKEPHVGNQLPAPTQFGLTTSAPYEPNTLAYALCDSPAGLLLYMLTTIKMLSPRKGFSPTELLTMTELTWLPGPEATMRFWAHCASTEHKVRVQSGQKPRASITVFLGGEESQDEAENGIPESLPGAPRSTYICPVWGIARYNLVSSHRVCGGPGLLAWERPALIATGVRNLSKAVLKVDQRLRPQERQNTTLLEQVVIQGSELAQAEISGTTVQDTTDLGNPSPSGPIAKRPGSPVQGAESSDTPLLKSASRNHLRTQTPPSKSGKQNRGVPDLDDDGNASGESPSTAVSTRVGA